MIIGLIVNLIKKIIDLATSFVAWLFVTLGLWIPFVYSLVFVIACALKGVTLSSVTALYFLGLFLSLFASVALSVHQVNRKFKRKNRRTSMQPGLEKRKDKVTLKNIGSEDVAEEDENIVKSKKALKQEKKAKKEKEASKPTNILEAARADSERKLKEDGYMSEESEEQKRREAKKILFGSEDDSEEADEEQKAKNARKILFGDQEDDVQEKEQKNAKKILFGEDDNEAETSQDDGIRRGSREFNMEDCQAEAQSVVTRGGYNPSEVPRIFATRKDPTIFIYEYSSRLDFYKRTRNGMIYMYSEYKGQ